MPHHSDDAKIKLFTPLFIDFIHQKFFKKEIAGGFELKAYYLSELKKSLPSIYQDTELVIWGLEYLESKEIIKQIPNANSNDPGWELTEQAIKNRLDEKAAADLNTRIDLELKKRTLDQMQAAAEDRQLIKDQIQSTINANNSSKETNEVVIPRFNRRQTSLTILTIAVAALSFVAIAFSAYYAKQAVTGEQLLQLDTTLQRNTILLNKMQQSQAEIDSSLRKAVKDSFYWK